MPVFDLPVNELYQYQGTNPRPDDFDAYWSKALAELDCASTDYELIPPKFTAPYAECFDMYFTGVRGVRIHAKVLRPKVRDKKTPALLMFHGLSDNSGDWSAKLAWVAAGFTVAALDVRGQGGLSDDAGGVRGNTFKGHITRGLESRDPHELLFRHVYLDCAQLARIVMKMEWVDPSYLCATGGSQGGGLTLACAALVPEIKRLAPVYPYLCDYRRVWNIDLAKNAYEDITEYFRRFDPTHSREEEVFTALGYIDLQFLAPRIKGEVMMATGLMDQICPPSSQFAAYNKITSKKRVILFPDYAHEFIPVFGDMMFEFFVDGIV